MISNIFLMRCYIALNFADIKWLKEIIQDERTVAKVYSAFQQIYETHTDYLLNLGISLEDTLFFLENYSVISAWLNDYGQNNAKKILRGTETDKARNIDFVKECLEIVKMVYPYLEDIDPHVINYVINAVGNVYIKKAAFLSAKYSKGIRSKNLGYILSSVKWRRMLESESFGSPQAIQCLPSLFKWDQEGSPLLPVFASLSWSQIMRLVEAAQKNSDFHNLAEYICFHLSSGLAAQALSKLDISIDSRWYLNRLIWVHRMGVDLLDFIQFSENVEFNQRIINQAIRKMRRMDAFAIETLFYLPDVYKIAWLFERRDVFQSYYNICESNQDLETPGSTVVSAAFAERRNTFLKNIAAYVLNREELNWLEYLFLYQRRLCQRINLNELTGKQLKKMMHIYNSRLKRRTAEALENSGFFNILGTRNLNCSELQVVLEILQSQNYAHSYLLKVFSRLLTAIRSDDAVIRCRQIMKHMDMELIEQGNDQKVTELLYAMDLPSWKRKLFSFPADYGLVLHFLSSYEEIKHALPEVRNAVEAKFLIENISLCRDSLREGFRHFIEADYAVNALKNTLELEPEFYITYAKESTDFFLQGNAALALDYWNSLNEKKMRDKYRIILKAAMSDKLHELRYFGNDLARECSFIPAVQTTKEWMCDRTCEVRSNLFGILSIYEDTTFSGTILLGKRPITTCLNYIDGDHRDCLLSAYDANKKVVYISVKGGHIIGRAIIRLTKMANKKINKAKSDLNFTDVTSVKTVPVETQMELGEEEAIEIPILFLERLYTPCQGDERTELELAVIHFISDKAKQAGIKAVLSKDYLKEDGFEEKRVAIYITRSRAGKQYLDSFGGTKSNQASTDAGKEDTYVFSKCYVAKVE